MKNILYLLLFISSVGYSQTPITDANFVDAIEDCLSTHPVTGLCVGSEYGPMPDWDVSNVTNMNSAFYNTTNFDANIGDWNVSNVTNMAGMFWGAAIFTGFSFFDVIFGDRAELLEHGTFMILVLVCYKIAKDEYIEKKAYK